jgi:transposase
MWTDENRARYDRCKLRYRSDLTDQEWSLIEPLIPPAKRGGNRRTVILGRLPPPWLRPSRGVPRSI